jgi:hypothetical protein
LSLDDRSGFSDMMCVYVDAVGALLDLNFLSLIIEPLIQASTLFCGVNVYHLLTLFITFNLVIKHIQKVVMADTNNLLRFLTAEAKLPLAAAIAQAAGLQKANLVT